MKIILLQDVKNFGKKGEIKEVSEGYAQNFLFPKKMAEIATAQTIRIVEEKREREKLKKQQEEQEFFALLEKIKKQKIVILAKEKGGKLFGSVLAKDIASALKKENLEIPERSIIIEKAIKKIGEHSIEIKLAERIKTEIKIEVKGN